MFLSPVSPEECVIVIPALNNKSYGLYNISTKLFSFYSEKKARLTLIFKNGHRNFASNYRPVSVLPIMSKIIEKCMHKRLCSYFTKHSFLCTNQSGFINKKSCFDAISNFLISLSIVLSMTKNT